MIRVAMGVNRKKSVCWMATDGFLGSLGAWEERGTKSIWGFSGEAAELSWIMEGH